jgi:hypothetical protein
MAKKAAKSGSYVPPVYGSYVFRDKDPVIDELRTLAEDYFGEKVTSKNLKEITTAGGPTLGTMRQWFFGKTKRPTSATVEAAGRSIGFERVWRKRKT